MDWANTAEAMIVVDSYSYFFKYQYTRKLVTIGMVILSFWSVTHSPSDDSQVLGIARKCRKSTILLYTN